MDRLVEGDHRTGHHAAVVRRHPQDGAGDLDRIEAQLRFLTEAGFSTAFAMDLMIAISRYTVGCVVEEQAEGGDEASRQALEESARGYPLTAIAVRHYRTSSHKAAFERGLRLLLDGAEAALVAMVAGASPQQ